MTLKLQKISKGFLEKIHQKILEDHYHAKKL